MRMTYFVVFVVPTAYMDLLSSSTVPEIIDPVFAKTSQNTRFLLSENERFGLVFVKTGSINSGTVDDSWLSTLN
jgi:hypothetical protein